MWWWSVVCILPQSEFNSFLLYLNFLWVGSFRYQFSVMLVMCSKTVLLFFNASFIFTGKKGQVVWTEWMVSCSLATLQRLQIGEFITLTNIAETLSASWVTKPIQFEMLALTVKRGLLDLILLSDGLMCLWLSVIEMWMVQEHTGHWTDQNSPCPAV